MVRPPRSRLIASLLVFLLGFTVLGGALMHGYAHHEAAHLEYGHHDRWASADHGETTVSAPERQHGHPHPDVGRAIGARPTHAHFALLLPPAVASGFEPEEIV